MAAAPAAARAGNGIAFVTGLTPRSPHCLKKPLKFKGLMTFLWRRAIELKIKMWRGMIGAFGEIF
jgi:hypothetical protein